jgi:hypothetical protein
MANKSEKLAAREDLRQGKILKLRHQPRKSGKFECPKSMQGYGIQVRE